MRAVLRIVASVLIRVKPKTIADSNGAGRLDRIEIVLENRAERQRQFQIIQEHDHEELARYHEALNEITDRRIADLLRAIDKRIKPDAPASPA